VCSVCKCAGEWGDLGWKWECRREMHRTCKALMKLLLRSMEASSTVVGPAPPTPLQPAAGPWRSGCIPPFPWLRRAVGGEGGIEHWRGSDA
jgi:hypothetical protein